MPNHSENNRRIVKNTFFLYLRMLLVMIVTLYTSRVVLKVLGVEDYGIYNVVGGVVSMLSFLSTAISNGYQRFFNIALGNNDEIQLQELYSTSFSIQIIFSIICIILGETIGLWFLNNCMVIPENRIVAANWVYQCSIFMFIITLFRTPYNAIIISYEKMNVFAYISILEVIGKLLIVFALVMIKYDKLIMYSVLHIVFSVIIYVLYAYSAKKCNKKLFFSINFNSNYIKSILSFSGWNLFGSLAHMLKGNGLNILLNIFFNPTVNAARAIAYQMSSAITSFSSNIMTASRPQIIKYYAIRDYNEMNKLSYRITKYSFFLLWCLSLPLIIKMDFVIDLWLGNNKPELASSFCKIVILTTLIESFGAPISTLVHASGNMKKFQLIISMIVMSILPISYITLRLGGNPQSAMYVSLFVNIIAHIVRIIIVGSIVKFDTIEYIKQGIVPCILVGSVSGLISIILFSKDMGTSVSILQILLIVICVLITIYYLGFNKTEKHAIKNKFKLYIKY